MIHSKVIKSPRVVLPLAPDVIQTLLCDAYSPERPWAKFNIHNIPYPKLGKQRLHRIINERRLKNFKIESHHILLKSDPSPANILVVSREAHTLFERSKLIICVNHVIYKYCPKCRQMVSLNDFAISCVTRTLGVSRYYTCSVCHAKKTNDMSKHLER